VLGVTIEQERDRMPVADALPDDGTLDTATRADALFGLVTLRYTQSNSVALVRDGAAVGIGAGQQFVEPGGSARTGEVADSAPRTASPTCRPACGSSATETSRRSGWNQGPFGRKILIFRSRLQARGGGNSGRSGAGSHWVRGS
jgi:hypothetical protein